MIEVTKIEGGTVVATAPDAMVSVIERVMLDPSIDIEKMERILAMKERMDAQHARVSFASALAAARAEIPPIVKDATVDFTSAKGRTHYRHETLAGIAKVIDPILPRYGLSYRFRTEQGNGGVLVTCIIAHAAGHSEETALVAPPDASGSKNGYQAIGSAVTYLQRYTLKAALGLSAEADDDAQGASPRVEQRRADPPEDFECDVQAAIRDIERETQMDSLAAMFTDLYRRQRRVADDPRVIAAKDAAKARINSEPKTGEILDDAFGY
ncbi:ERF family protein [Pseudogemmobacter sonorensis]|uniref:ERF family protein n=1 Tax=Pseudogemmobacter sonorensis TaxID=2989681 RepID=UPI0036C91508